jgi:hypothetical protein
VRRSCLVEPLSWRSRGGLIGRGTNGKKRLEASTNAEVFVEMMIAYEPAAPLALGRIECAAGLDVLIKVVIYSETSALTVLGCSCQGRSSELVIMVRPLERWTEKFA